MRLLATCVFLAVSGSARAQPAPAPSPEPTPPPPPTAEPPAADAKLEALQVDLEDLQGENEDLRSELDDLRERFTAASRRPTPLNALNPQIIAFLNTAARYDDRPVTSAAGTQLEDRVFLRTAEVELRAAVDPYADAVAILALEDEAGEGFEADIEEAYALLKRLPILESAPLGLKLKIGRYRAPIGNVNRLHMHDLPWTTRPLAIARLLGTEQGEFFESGYNPVGVDAEFSLPSFADNVVSELNLDVVDGGGLAISGGGDRRPAYLGHYNLFFTVHDSHDVNLGVSGYTETGDLRARLIGADLLYKWKPLKGGEFKSFVLGGELLYAERRAAVELDNVTAIETEHPWAWFAFAQYQPSWHVYLGARYDRATDVANSARVTQVAAGYVSYYTSEFLRLRLGYEHRWSDLAADDGLDSAFAEVNVVFGSHPTEPYWVNR